MKATTAEKDSTIEGGMGESVDCNERKRMVRSGPSEEM
jgi:hypothetical protein